ncbi:unnamed protein product [Angiostrongylus costaricensis]|uniref:DUF148 domain-containing protein n=1 Tax=Angiostrongylus costaricensis TaxID=334426 RepID=A0A0R3PXA5_ANGCS|nr:unnamed protein product [Angiostrongylus costaricensis]
MRSSIFFHASLSSLIITSASLVLLERHEVKSENSKVIKRGLPPETLELIHLSGIARAAGNRELRSELAKQCSQAIKEDRKQRAAVMAEAAEVGKSIRKAHRSFANYKSKMIALRRPDGIVTASRKEWRKSFTIKTQNSSIPYHWFSVPKTGMLLRQ